MDDGSVVAVVAILLIGLPWLVLHYMTKWKTGATLTNDDEALLEDLHQLARRLDERMETVERLVRADNPDFHPTQAISDHASDRRMLSELDHRRGIDRQPIAMDKLGTMERNMK